MRVIFSRKGFDSRAGGVPSPIINGHFISLPIPAAVRSATTYERLGLGKIVEDLTGRRIGARQLCHDDPDFRFGALGPGGAARGHLERQGVGAGDLFLFWGLFRQAEKIANGYRYVRSARKEHWLFGWLQVAKVIALGEDGSWFVRKHPELARHPHCRPGWGAHNTLYVATKRVRVGGRTLNVPGAGIFPEAREMLRLTARGENRSLWTVPAWLKRVGLSYHRDPARWGRETLQVVARGQEFVADVDNDPDAFAWLEELFQNTRPRATSRPRTVKLHKQRPRNRIWRYVVATDSGYAPCIDRRMLSLCICKPIIRLGAAVGDWVIGFEPKRFGPPTRVVWAGRVSEKLLMGQYQMQYPRRRDAIYKLLRITPDGQEVLEHIGVERHADMKSQESDKRGKNALIFREFWYWGGNAPRATEEIARLAYYRQGQTTRGAGPREAEHIEKWLCQWTPGVHGRPRDGVRTRSKRSC